MSQEVGFVVLERNQVLISTVVVERENKSVRDGGGPECMKAPPVLR